MIWFDTSATLDEDEEVDLPTIDEDNNIVDDGGTNLLDARFKAVDASIANINSYIKVLKSIVHGGVAPGGAVHNEKTEISTSGANEKPDLIKDATNVEDDEHKITSISIIGYDSCDNGSIFSAKITPANVKPAEGNEVTWRLLCTSDDPAVVLMDTEKNEGEFVLEDGLWYSKVKGNYCYILFKKKYTMDSTEFNSADLSVCLSAKPEVKDNKTISFGGETPSLTEYNVNAVRPKVDTAENFAAAKEAGLLTNGELCFFKDKGVLAVFMDGAFNSLKTQNASADNSLTAEDLQSVELDGLLFKDAFDEDYRLSIDSDGNIKAHKW